MKQKLFALLMTCALAAAGSMTAFAAEEMEENNPSDDVIVYQWANYKEKTALKEYAGKMATLGETGFEMYVPADFEAQAEADLQAEGYAAWFQLDEEHGIAVTAEALEGYSLADYALFLQEDESLYDVTQVSINGHAGVAYCMSDEDDEEQEIRLVSMQKDDQLITFMCYPTNDEAFDALCTFMIASIQEAED